MLQAMWPGEITNRQPHSVGLGSGAIYDTNSGTQENAIPPRAARHADIYITRSILKLYAIS